MMNLHLEKPSLWEQIRWLFFTSMLLTLVGCVGSPTVPDSPVLINISDINDMEKAEQAWRDFQISKYREVWLRASTNGFAADASRAAYELALVTDDPAWSKAAIEQAEKALKEQTGSPTRLRGLLGASHRMAARNFPFKGAAQYILMGTPGWMRAYHVRASISNLNQAVAAAPDDPQIRLYRATSYCGIPVSFGVRDTCYEDFAQLQHWVDEPTNNKSFGSLLSSAIWLETYHVMRARSMEQLNNEEKARKAWQNVSKKTQNPYLRLLSELLSGGRQNIQ